MNRKLFYSTIGVYLAALTIWTVFFHANPVLQNVLSDIHLIFSSTLFAYVIIRFTLNTGLREIAKILIRTLFRVWLLIIITISFSHSMEKAGTLLSLTFIFGYLEGLFDLGKWLETHPLGAFGRLKNRSDHALGAVLLMSIIHIICAIVAFLLVNTIPIQ